MPKGLGDNPLKKENRSRRTGLGAPSGSGAPRKGSASYNDVFFQRRPEDSSPVVTSPVEQNKTESVDFSPMEATVVVAPDIAPAVPQEVTSVVMEPSVAEPVQSALMIALLPDPSPAVAAVPAQEPKEQVSAEPAPQPQTTVATTEQESKPGFFGRIFGRLRK